MKKIFFKKIILIKLVLLFSLYFITYSTSILNAQSIQKDVSVTIYNNNLGVVKDIREINLEKGINTINISDVASSLSPSSVLIKLPAKVIEQNYQYDLVNLTKILEKYIDKEVNIRLEDNIITGKLLTANNQIVLQKQDGGLVMLPDISKCQITVPELPENLITRPTLVWTINSEKTEKQTAELTYHTSGISWLAEYVAELDENDKNINLSAWVTIKNTSGATYNNAKLKLIAGDINQVQLPIERSYKTLARTNLDYEANIDGFEEKNFFEYHLYDLGRRTTIKNNENKQISLFEAKSIPVQKVFEVSTPSLSSYTQKENINVNVLIKFKNSKDNNLGIPLPKGKIKMNKSDGTSTEFIGEDIINHTPKNEIISVMIGKAFDVLLTSKTINRKKISKEEEEVEVEYTLKNHKNNENIEVQFNCPVGYFHSWKILQLDYKWTKKDANTITFTVPIKKETETKFIIKARLISN